MALPFRNLNLANSIARLFGFRPDVPVGQRSPWKLLRRGRIGATLANWYGPELSERKPWPEPEKLQVNRERIAVRSYCVPFCFILFYFTLLYFTLFYLFACAHFFSVHSCGMWIVFAACPEADGGWETAA